MNLTTLKLLGVGWNTAKPGWRLAGQTHPHHELIIILRGAQYVELDGPPFRAATGDALWFREGAAHTEWADSGDPVESVFLSLEWQKLPKSFPSQVSDTEGRLAQLARWLHDERNVDPSLVQPIAGALAQAIAAEYLRLATRPPHPLVSRMRKFLRQNLAEPLTLDDLARASELSKFHFVRRYRALTGRTPMEDLRLIRLTATRDLLLTTALTLKEIAPRCGLGDEFHLARVFRRHFKIPPGAVRRKRSGILTR